MRIVQQAVKSTKITYAQIKWGIDPISKYFILFGIDASGRHDHKSAKYRSFFKHNGRLIGYLLLDRWFLFKKLPEHYALIIRYGRSFLRSSDVRTFSKCFASSSEIILRPNAFLMRPENPVTLSEDVRLEQNTRVPPSYETAPIRVSMELYEYPT